MNKEKQELNNRVLFDLHLKSTRITTIIDMLLDINNNDDIEHELINGEVYNEVQDNIINVLNKLSPIYIDYLKMRGEKEKKDEQEETN